MGALPEVDELIIVWFKMLTRPFILNTNKGYIFTQCHTFNKILESTITKFSNARVLQLDLPENRDAFDFTGCLSSAGKLDFCRKFNRQIRKLDISLQDACRCKIHAKVSEEIAAQLAVHKPEVYKHHRHTTWKKHHHRDFPQHPEFKQLLLEHSYHTFNRK